MEALLIEQALQPFLAWLPRTNTSYGYSVTKKEQKIIRWSWSLKNFTEDQIWAQGGKFPTAGLNADCAPWIRGEINSTALP